VFSVVIPLFNEEKSLPELQKRLHRVMEGLSCEYQIIYVDDGSCDSSPAVLKKLKENYSAVSIVSLKKRGGKGRALLAGFKEASEEWIVTLDADLQNPPEEIPKLLQFKDDFDLIMGVRKNRKDSPTKKAASSAARFFRRAALGDTTKDAGCGLQAFRKDVIDFPRGIKNFYLYLAYFAKIKGFSIKEVDIGHEARLFGKSKYGITKRAWEGVFDMWEVRALKNRLLKDRITTS